MTVTNHLDQPMLRGMFVPLEAELDTNELAVTGTVPAGLEGMFVRNGPNPIGEIDPELYHWFLGDGMVHGVRLRNGKAEWHRNRFVQTPNITDPVERPPTAPRELARHRELDGLRGLAILGVLYSHF